MKALTKIITLVFFLIAAVVACKEYPTQIGEKQALGIEIATLEIYNSPIEMTFHKVRTHKVRAGQFLCEGYVEGDIIGRFTTTLLESEGGYPAENVAFEWIVSSKQKSFTAVLSGIIYYNTGKIVMNGEVDRGWLKGARVYLDGQISQLGSNAIPVEGTIKIMPNLLIAEILGNHR